VVNKLDTGFHELNSVLSRIDLYDEIRIKDESSFSISYNGPFGDQVGSNDHISKLFNYLIDKNYLKQKSFAIHVVKNIPVGSGLGGGSSNVAEIIKYLIRSNLLDNSSSTEIARDLGSDIEFFIDEGSALISGKGNVDQRLKINSDKHFLIVFPNVQNSTKDIFNKHSNLSGEKFSYNKDTNLDGILKGTSNELEKTALLANQEMKKIREYLDNDINCKYERMTGSGSAYFTVYEDKQKAEEAIQRISEEHPNWWTYLTRLI
jgi:4-diphosphocytidyl-2-C-methyl-D-erythritol kinase